MLIGGFVNEGQTPAGVLTQDCGSFIEGECGRSRDFDRLVLPTRVGKYLGSDLGDVVDVDERFSTIATGASICSLTGTNIASVKFCAKWLGRRTVQGIGPAASVFSARPTAPSGRNSTPRADRSTALFTPSEAATFSNCPRAGDQSVAEPGPTRKTPSTP